MERVGFDQRAVAIRLGSNAGALGGREDVEVGAFCAPARLARQQGALPGSRRSFKLPNHRVGRGVARDRLVVVGAIQHR